MYNQINYQNSNYWLNLKKPAGISSARAVAIVKRITGAKKVGHGGTLDPFAEGVLPIALNKATKTSIEVMNKKKKYKFTIKFGEFRDTDDVEGKVIATNPNIPKPQQIISILPLFVGKIKQTPSKFSAIKINGKRSYEMARQNLDFVMPEREIEIYSLSLISAQSDLAELEVECSKGTYVRSLSRDLCNKLSLCGYLKNLVRIEVGEFCYSKSISLDELKLKVSFKEGLIDGSFLAVHSLP